jgi:hypothetical protein
MMDAKMKAEAAAATASALAALHPCASSQSDPLPEMGDVSISVYQDSGQAARAASHALISAPNSFCVPGAGGSANGRGVTAGSHSAFQMVECSLFDSKELSRLRRLAPQNARRSLSWTHRLCRDENVQREAERTRLAELLPKSNALRTMYSMRFELASIWGRSMATRDQLVAQLQEWCQRAESSGIDELQEFSRTLRSYT